MARKKRAETELDQEMAKKPGIGDNSGELTDEQRRALRMHHVRALLDINDRLKPLKDERKQARALAKADGFKLSEIDAAMRLATMEDTSIFVAEIHELIEIAKAFNALPPGEQGDLFPDRRPADERCFDEGKVAGLAGKQPEPPYGADSPNGQAWLKGWHAGQQVMRDTLEADMNRKNAARQARQDEADSDMQQVADALPPIEMPAAA
jgi:ribosome modulation factor/uncharacterized membrane protein